MILPTELIAIVLEHLDITTIHRCRQVSRAVRDLIDTSVAIQYKIELAVAGMEDGPPSNLRPVDRLKILKEHQSSWHKLTWKNDHLITMFDYEWECLGGVLAYVLDEPYRSLGVRQLPSVLRGIKGMEWQIDMNFTIDDFTIDPSQDLVAVVEKYNDWTVRIHACTLSTGKQHPLSVGPHTYPRASTPAGTVIYELQICGSVVGILHPLRRFNIWNWKTGDVKMDIQGGIESFSFLSEQYVMIALLSSGTSESLMSLDIFDLGSAHDDSALCSFHFPVGNSVGPHYTTMSIRCDITSGRTSHSYGSVPFTTSQSDRLYVVSCTSTSQEVPPLTLFVHLSTLLTKIATLPPGTKGHTFAWSQWGEDGTRVLHLEPSDSWITYVHGTKFALLRNEQLEVYDFNKLSVKRNHVRMHSNMEPTDTHLLCNPFVGPVYSRLPYDMRVIPMSNRFGVLLTEDSLILIKAEHVGNCTVVTF